MKTLRHTQTIERLPLEALFRLSGSQVASPYFSLRDNRLITKIMAVDRAVVETITGGSTYDKLNVSVHFMDGSTGVDYYNIEFSIGAVYANADYFTAAVSAINSYASGQGYTLSNGIIWPWARMSDVSALLPAPISESSLSLSVQTSTGAVGTQVDASRNSFVMVNTSVTTTATIGGASTGDMVIEIAPTNSATAGDWVEKGRTANSQTVSLAIILNSVQVIKGMLVAFVPAGYYVKVRSITGAGTPTYAISSARKALM